MAPAVRFIALEIFATGDLLFECALRALTCSLVQATRLVRLLVFFGLAAIGSIPFMNTIASTLAHSIEQLTNKIIRNQPP